jgi:small GTP-binding protein
MTDGRFLKVIVIGGSGVGKSSLISAYFNEPFYDQKLSTLAPALQSATIRLGESTVTLQIWDTAGHERYQSISQMYYRGSNLAFLCNDQQSFDSIDLWVAQLRANVADCFIFLVVTKADLLSESDYEAVRQRAKAKVTQIQAQNYFITSARTGIGVQELFTEAAKMYTHPYQIERSVLNASKRKKLCC